eukprot:gb/GECG01016327.1/.p1 GENE.gb/GECG01016327.1/~~gb/GECG01016327.1/.p1  ORF type:complete len:1013 (+),score=104.65 gb/GECG01016327.1/:1-3039(+)
MLSAGGKKGKPRVDDDEGDGHPGTPQFEVDELRKLEHRDVVQLGGPIAIAEMLGVQDIKHGLNSADVEKNRSTYGKNELPTKQPRGFVSHLMESFEDATLIILIVSAVVSIAFGLWTSDETELIQGVAILIAIVIVSGVTSVQNWSKDKEFASLSEIKADRPVYVVRDGHEREVSIKEIVVGDIITFNVGDSLPCDGVLVDGHQVQCDESDMTGESMPRRKGPRDCILWGGCKIIEGDGHLLATSVGENSQYGEIVKSLEQGDPPPTPLQEKLEVLAEQIGYLGMACGTLTSVALTVMWAREVEDFSNADYTEVLSFFIVGLSIVVVAVPEGLPLAVTISLAFSMRKMLKDKNLVRELKSCETMGSATCICSDKTGTLTENRMTVATGLFFGRSFSMDHFNQVKGYLDPGSLNRLIHAIAYNSTARVEWDGHDNVEYKGNKTEGALLYMIMKDFKEDPREHCSDEHIVYRQSFSSERKTMLTVVSSEAEDQSGHYFVYVKGAGENILPHCSTLQKTHGQTSKLTEEMRYNYLEQMNDMARGGNRTLAVAYKRVEKSKLPSYLQTALTSQDAQTIEDAWDRFNKEGMLENNLTCIALLGIRDPIREEVPSAVKQCMRAGIRVIMVTGDNMLTAKSIGSQCSIYKPGTTDLCMEGADFRELEHDDRLEAARTLHILARSSPQDKLLLVQALRELGEIVAVTGDGTNDAPALKAAHVGLSMGIAGTEVAKEASDIIILDDNFASIVLSVRWGRAIMENIRKFLTFQLTINLVALTITFLVACTHRGSTEQLPLTPVQLLWINLIMDSFAALALATEPPSHELLGRKPEGRNVGLITPLMWKNLVGHAMFQTGLLLVLTMTQSMLSFFNLTEDDYSKRPHYTVVFNVFVLMNVFNMLNCRKVHDEMKIWEHLTSSYFLETILTVIVSMQFVIVQFGGEITQTTPLSFTQWRNCVLLGALSIPVGFLLKLIPIEEGIAGDSTKGTSFIGALSGSTNDDMTPFPESTEEDDQDSNKSD